MRFALLAAPYLVPTRLHITRHFFWIGGFYEIALDSFS
jgi:hypothetical protein